MHKKNTFKKSRSGTRLNGIVACCSVAVVTLFLGYFSLSDSPSDTSPRVGAVLEEKTESQSAPAVPSGPVLAVHPGVIGSGDTASSILAQWISPADLHVLAQLCKPVFNLRQIRLGQPYRIYTEDGQLSRLEYEMDDDQYLVVIPQKSEAQACDPFSVEVHDIPYEYRTDVVEGTIASNLFEAVEQSGESPALAIHLADIFGWEVDFIRDLREGDTFRVVVEKRFRDGEFKGYKRVIAASFTNQGELHEGFRMEDEQGITQFYNAEGGNLRRAFLKAPLAFQRISSNYSGRRLHPVLKTYRPHHGVDYAAPTGTPVHAIGDGTVIKVARDHAAGKYIKIRHSNGYESGYLHLSGYAKSIKRGKRVRQGQTIGYVGSTGYATGPHLDFRMKKNGSYVNPRKVISPRSEPVSKAKRAEFDAIVEKLRPQIEAAPSVATVGTSAVSNTVQNISN